jgi:hypothetical protein
MDSYLSTAEASRGLAAAPVLIAGSSRGAIVRASQTVEAAGLRIADRVSINHASDRLGQQVAATTVWIELDEDGGEPMDSLLQLVARDVAAGRYSAVVSGSMELIDPITANLNESAVGLIVNGSESDRAAALALAISSLGGQQRVSDIAGDKNAVRLRQLSDEVSRIASTLARLSAGPDPSFPTAESAPTEIPEVSADVVRSVIRARRLRSRFFPDDLFADPAWDMLLDLLQAEIAQLRVPVSSLCIAAAVPATTALRWLKTMTDRGLFVRRADPHDGRRVFVELSPSTSLAMRRYFADVGRPAAI